MSKKIVLTARPPAVSPQADSWVSAPEAPAPTGPTKRLTIDIPEENHTRFKVLCARNSKTMAAEINAFIERRLAEEEG